MADTDFFQLDESLPSSPTATEQVGDGAAPVVEPAPVQPQAVETSDLWPDGHPLDTQNALREQETKSQLTNDQTRFQYQQSRADKEANARKAAETEIARLKAEREELTAAILRQATGRAPEPAPVAEGPKVPVRPTAPTVYNETEALGDPSSESYKYRKQLEQYNADRVDHLEKQLLAQAEQAQIREQRAAQQQQVNQKLGEVRQTLMRDMKFQPAEVDEFFSAMSAEPTLEDLALLFRAKKGAAVKGVAPVQQAMAERAARQRVPLPVAATGGYTQPTMTDEDAFNTDMLSWKR